MEKSNKCDVIVLDVDGAIVQQKRLMEQYQPTVISLQDKSEELRYWCRMEKMDLLRNMLVSLVGTVKRKVIFYGSGDYHHLAYLGISLVDEPVTVIHFDAHTDFLKGPKGYIHAGCWVIKASELLLVRKVIQLGIEGDLGIRKDRFLPIGTMTHQFNLLCDGKVETYPNSTRRSIFLGRMRASLPCVELKPGLLTTEANWKNIQDHGGIEASLERILTTISTDAVYITIDKDVLRESDSFTNYLGEQGTMTLDELLAAISQIEDKKRIFGVDICGDGSYSAAKAYPIKRYIAHWKDKGITKGTFSSPENIRLNEDVNIKILQQLRIGK